MKKKMVLRGERVEYKELPANAISRRDGRDEFEASKQEAYRLEERDFHRAEQMGDFFWKGIDPRRRIELADGGMVREDRKAMANLPTQAIHTEYPERDVNSYGFGTNQLFDGVMISPFAKSREE